MCTNPNPNTFKLVLNLRNPASIIAQRAQAHNYAVGNLHCRSLVSVVRKKLAHPQCNQCHGFHYDPFGFLWKSLSGAEVSTSQKTKRQLQSILRSTLVLAKSLEEGTGDVGH
jgi:hypothetical protein